MAVMDTVRDPLTFIRFLLITGLLTTAACRSTSTPDRDRYLPGGTIPEKLWVHNIGEDYGWDLKNTLYCFQGLVNRKATRIYFVEGDHDQFWLDYYRDHYGIPYERVGAPSALFEKFSDEIGGYLLYDGRNPHVLNLATTVGAIKGLVPTTTAVEPLLKSAGLVRKDSIPMQTGDRLSIYGKAMQDWLPDCNQKLLAALCVHDPHWPTSTIRNRDYIMAHKVFSFDLSSSERDKADYRLTKQIYEQVPSGAVVMGWHCVRDKEHESIALSSEYGHYGMCSLHTSNLTVHSSIPVPAGKMYRQRPLDTAGLKLEDKVYIAYMATDGDATWFMADLINTDWRDPQHGRFKYNWGFLPLAYDLMPGTVNYYLENALETDYFVAGPSGATYTYPFMHPEPSDFLELSNEYMKKCGLQTVHMTNWNDRDWWQEVDLHGFYDTLLRTMPDAIGFVRGMGESAFEPHYLHGEKPYIFCGEGIHRGNDVYQTMRDFIDACPNRPLFVYNLVNHSIPMGEVKEAMDRFPQNEVEVVHLDELLYLADLAYKKGMIGEDLYPHKEGLRAILAREALQAWPGTLSAIRREASWSGGGRDAYVDSLSTTPAGVEPVVPADHLLFTTIWNSMSLVKNTLESRGIYVNHKPTAVKRFIQTFDSVPDTHVIVDLHALWQRWHRIDPGYAEARQYTSRLHALAERMDALMRDSNYVVN